MPRVTCAANRQITLLLALLTAPGMPGAVFSLAMGPGAVALHRYRVSKSGVAPFQGPGAVAQAPIAIVFPRSVTKMHGYEYPRSPLRLQMETYGLNKATSVCLNRILLCRLDRILLPQPKKDPPDVPGRAMRRSQPSTFVICANHSRRKRGFPKSSGPIPQGTCGRHPSLRACHRMYRPALDGFGVEG